MNNVIIIGKNAKDLAEEVWLKNTQFSLIESENIKNEDFLKYIESRFVIGTSSMNQFKDYSAEDFSKFCIKYNFIPVFVSSKENSAEEKLYTELEKFYDTSLFYKMTVEHKDIDICVEMISAMIYDRNFEQTNIKDVSDDSIIQASGTGQEVPIEP